MQAGQGRHVDGTDLWILAITLLRLLRLVQMA
jgi:hypothetical protein